MRADLGPAGCLGDGHRRGGVLLYSSRPCPQGAPGIGPWAQEAKLHGGRRPHHGMLWGGTEDA